MEYLSEIIWAVIGFLAGFTCKVVIDKSKKVTQKHIKAGGDVAGGNIRK